MIMRYTILVLFLFSGVMLGKTWTVCASGCDNTTIAATLAEATFAHSDKIHVYGETFEESVSADLNYKNN